MATRTPQRGHGGEAADTKRDDRQKRISQKRQDRARKKQREIDHRSNLAQLSEDVSKDLLGALIGGTAGGRVGQVALRALSKKGAAKKLLQKVFGKGAHGRHDVRAAGRVTGTLAGSKAGVKTSKGARSKK